MFVGHYPAPCGVHHIVCSHVQLLPDGVPLLAVVKPDLQPRQLGIGMASVPPAL